MHCSLMQSVHTPCSDGTCMSTVLLSHPCSFFMFYMQGFVGTCLARSSRCTFRASASHALQVLHVLGHCVCDPPSGRLHLPMHSHDLQEHCGGQRPGHAPAAVLHPAGRLCHCQALHPPLGCVVSHLAVTIICGIIICLHMLPWDNWSLYNVFSGSY